MSRIEDLKAEKTPMELWHDAIVKGMEMNAEMEKTFRAACALCDAEKAAKDERLIA
jgi:hypothetical protein